MAACLAGVWLLVAVVQASAEDRSSPIRIGVLDYSGQDHTLTDWGPTRAALDRALPAHDVDLVTLDIHALEAVVAEGAVDFVITNPGHYAELEYRYRISRMAQPDEA